MLVTKNEVKVNYIGPFVLSDNETSLINLLCDICNYSDPGYRANVIKKEDEIIMHIQPGTQEFKQDIIDNLLHINREQKLMVKFSKSLAISKTISLSIALRNVKEGIS